MTAFQPIQDILNGSTLEQEKFRDDPVAYLNEKGISLSQDAMRRLNSHVKNQAASRPDWGNYCVFVADGRGPGAGN